MQFTNLELDATGREKAVRGTPMFPCAIYDTDISKFTGGEIPWHWHGELELMVVKDGALALCLPERKVLLRAGQGAFINANVLHSIRPMGQPGGRFLTLVFDAALIGGAKESAFHVKYVRPVLACRALQFFKFDDYTPWQHEAMECFLHAYDYYANEPFGYELLIRSDLSRLWYLLTKNLVHVLAATPAPTEADDERVKRMLGFLQTHYAEQITLEQIAASANISQRECFRCFERTLGMPPVEYLVRYRIGVAADLLIGTKQPVTDVCFAVGFRDPSYFSKIFRKQLGCTPRQYRSSDAARSGTAE